MIDTLFVGLSKTIETGDFQYLMSAYIGVLREKGLNVDRLQIPMNKISGLRHPRYGVILLTYADDELDTMYIPHEGLQHANNTGFDHLRHTPFAQFWKSQILWYNNPCGWRKLSLIGFES